MENFREYPDHGVTLHEEPRAPRSRRGLEISFSQAHGGFSSALRSLTSLVRLRVEGWDGQLE